MGEWNRGVVTLQFQDGEEIFIWESFTLRDSYTDPLGSFTFRTRPQQKGVIELANKLKKGSLVGILINGNPQGSFLIVTPKRTISTAMGVAFEVTCRTVLATPYVGHVDPDISESFPTDAPVSNVILQALGPYGFDTIIADNTANVQALTGKSVDGRSPDIQVEAIKHKDAKASEGETAYGFCSRIFARLGLVLRVNFEGTLLIGSPDYDQQPLYTVGQSSNLQKGDAFFGEIFITDTNEGQFSEVVVRGQDQDEEGQKRAGRPIHRLKVEGNADPSGEFPFSEAPLTTVPAGRHTYVSEGGAVYKPFYRLDKFSRDQEYAKTLCHRIHGRQAESGFVIEGVVDGLISSTGAVWSVDTVVHVRIEKANIDEPMWILEVGRAVSRGAGQATSLKIIPLNSLILAAA